MPKSSKKRKEKAADFAKAKLKLGKGKKAPSNEIDTSFKARSVALPNQTIRTEERATEQGVPTTRRRLSYDDLLVHLRHYSPGTRKDALQGLRELLSDHPELIVPNLGSLLGAVSKLVADDDHSVRKSLVSFLEWVLDQVPVTTLTPHAPPLLLFAAAALAHITAPVRADAVRVIGVLLERIPLAVVSGAGFHGARQEGPGARILDGLLAALGVGDSRGAGGDHSLTSSTKSTLLATLSIFLHHALRSPSASISTVDSTPTWYFAPSFPSSVAFDSFASMLESRASGAELEARFVNLDRGEVVAGSLGCDLDALEDGILGFELEGDESRGVNPLNVLASRLHPLLTATFLDSAPQLHLSSSPPIELVSSAVELARLVYGATIREGHASEETFENLNALLGHMSSYFPFGDRMQVASTEPANVKTREGMQSLNLAYCELVSLLVSRTSAPKSTRRTKKRPAGSIGSKQVDEVALYVVRSLRGEVGSTPGLPSNLSLAAYTALLPTLWALREERDVIPATLQHATSGGNKAVKRAAVEFVGRVVLINSDPRCATVPSLSNADVKEWVSGLPRTVWEFGEKDARGTEIVLLILLRMNQRQLHDGPTREALRQRLTPFFMVDHAKRGAVAGPWTKLPARLQRLALDVMSSLCQGGGDGVATLTNAIDRAAAQTALAEYWKHVRPAL